MRRYGWSFGRCLSFSWAKAREQRARLHAASLTVYCPRQKATPLAREDEQAGCFLGGRSFPCPAEAPYFPLKPLTVIKGGGTMANRQQRGNREQKKPKKDKSKIVPASPGSIWETVDKAHTRTVGAGKK